ncbi:hypothetical protein [Gluconobacter sp. Gdi]|uniref:hypothetical protein n=1 Tax=Gluconobacter sp. Gdi TaxID=2691888 RepID=UPI001920685B|nr:hypothetical protein [Gluconobacter sp. Gdi]
MSLGPAFAAMQLAHEMPGKFDYIIQLSNGNSLTCELIEMFNLKSDDFSGICVKAIVKGANGPDRVWFIDPDHIVSVSPATIV